MKKKNEIVACRKPININARIPLVSTNLSFDYLNPAPSSSSKRRIFFFSHDERAGKIFIESRSIERTDLAEKFNGGRGEGPGQLKAEREEISGDMGIRRIIRDNT